MGCEKMKINFKKIEEIVEKIVLWLLIILQILSEFIPQIDTFISNHENLKIAVLFYLVFKIYKRIIDINEKKQIKILKLDDALSHVFTKKKFKKVYIFAYSAQNYLKSIKRNDIQIDNLYLLLRRYDEKQAFLLHDPCVISNYKNELENALKMAYSLKNNGSIKNLHVRYFDFEAYSHFAVFDSRFAVSGKLLHTFNDSKTKISPVQIYDSNTNKSIDDIISNFKDFFENLFNNSCEDSGLKILVENECCTCNEISDLSDPHLQKMHTTSEMSNFAIIPYNQFDDFVLMPDMRPLSKVHLLLTTKFHILSMFQYLRRPDAISNLEKIIKKLDSAIYDCEQKHIIIFEHGSFAKNSKTSGKSIDHLHLHILLNEDYHNFEPAIKNDRKKVVDTNDPHCRYFFNTLEEFARFDIAGRKDYFLIWNPSAQNNKITVFFPTKKESQFLRRICFSMLTLEEKKELGLITEKKSSLTDGYDWKKYKGSFTEREKIRYTELGKAIERNMNNEYR